MITGCAKALAQSLCKIPEAEILGKPSDVRSPSTNFTRQKNSQRLELADPLSPLRKLIRLHLTCKRIRTVNR